MTLSNQMINWLRLAYLKVLQLYALKSGNCTIQCDSALNFYRDTLSAHVTVKKVAIKHPSWTAASLSISFKHPALTPPTRRLSTSETASGDNESTPVSERRTKSHWEQLNGSLQVNRFIHSHIVTVDTMALYFPAGHGDGESFTLSWSQYPASVVLDGERRVSKTAGRVSL